MSAKVEPQDGQTKRAVQGLKNENLTAMISRRSRQYGQSLSRRRSISGIDFTALVLKRADESYTVAVMFQRRPMVANGNGKGGVTPAASRRGQPS
jgi:hypothetical protein